MSRYRKKKTFPLSMLVLVVVLALVFALPAYTSFFMATGGGNTPSGGNSPSGGVVTPPSEEEPDGSGGTVDEPQVDDNGNCLHTTTVLTAQYMTQDSCLPTIKCARCGEPIQSLPKTPHAFEDGVCTMCQHVCEHPGVAEDDPCPYCGLGCIHAETSYHSCYTTGYATHTEYHVCADCGYKKGVPAACSFENSNMCKLCGFICTHEKTTVIYESGNNTQHFERTACSTCGWDMGSELLAHTFESGTCTVCQHVCPHEYKGGICGYCKLTCKHTITYAFTALDNAQCEKNGTCTACGYEDNATYNHDYNKTGICATCGHVCTHDGKNQDDCTHCGRQYVLVRNPAENTQYVSFYFWPGTKWSELSNVDAGTIIPIIMYDRFVGVDTGWGQTYYLYNSNTGMAMFYDDVIPVNVEFEFVEAGGLA